MLQYLFKLFFSSKQKPIQVNFQFLPTNFSQHLAPWVQKAMESKNPYVLYVMNSQGKKRRAWENSWNAYI